VEQETPALKNSRGFTLIELLIVVSMILIIAAITIPSLLHSKMNADEASAVASIRAINTAEITYQAAYPAQGYAASLANLGGAEPCARSAETACLLDQSLAGGSKSGYTFVAIGGSQTGGVNMTYAVGAAPVAYDRTGIHLFCSTDRQVIRQDPNAGGSTVPPDAQQCLGFKALQ
jgi:type IV pilus assembly protein PilA